jgi:ribosomal protein L9
MSYWQKGHERDPQGDYVKVTNGYGKTFLCKNSNEADWLLRLLQQHADKPETWSR